MENKQTAAKAMEKGGKSGKGLTERLSGLHLWTEQARRKTIFEEAGLTATLNDLLIWLKFHGPTWEKGDKRVFYAHLRAFLQEVEEKGAPDDAQFSFHILRRETADVLRQCEPTSFPDVEHFRSECLQKKSLIIEYLREYNELMNWCKSQTFGLADHEQDDQPQMSDLFVKHMKSFLNECVSKWHNSASQCFKAQMHQVVHNEITAKGELENLILLEQLLEQ